MTEETKCNPDPELKGYAIPVPEGPSFPERVKELEDRLGDHLIIPDASITIEAEQDSPVKSTHWHCPDCRSIQYSQEPRELVNRTCGCGGLFLVGALPEKPDDGVHLSETEVRELKSSDVPTCPRCNGALAPNGDGALGCVTPDCEEAIKNEMADEAVRHIESGDRDLMPLEQFRLGEELMRHLKEQGVVSGSPTRVIVDIDLEAEQLVTIYETHKGGDDMLRVLMGGPVIAAATGTTHTDGGDDELGAQLAKAARDIQKDGYAVVDLKIMGYFNRCPHCRCVTSNENANCGNCKKPLTD